MTALLLDEAELITACEKYIEAKTLQLEYRKMHGGDDVLLTNAVQQAYDILVAASPIARDQIVMDLTLAQDEIVRVRPKADAYDRICKELGITNDILGYIKKLQELPPGDSTAHGYESESHDEDSGYPEIVCKCGKRCRGYNLEQAYDAFNMHLRRAWSTQDSDEGKVEKVARFIGSLLEAQFRDDWWKSVPDSLKEVYRNYAKEAIEITEEK